MTADFVAQVADLGGRHREVLFRRLGAVLCAQLTRLDEQTACRLDSLLRPIPGISPQAQDERITRNGYYAYIFHFDRRAFSGISRQLA